MPLAACLPVLWAFWLTFNVSAAAYAQPLAVADRLGVTHVAGKYHLTQKPFLDEGADAIEQLGSRVIKVYLSLAADQAPAKLYPFNQDFEPATTLAQLAASPPFRRLLDRPFTTFILTVYRPGKTANYWRDKFTPEHEAAETREFAELTEYLLRTYQGTGKTFVLQHWEGDWSLLGSFDAKAEFDPAKVEQMIRWLRARQAGVDRAREASKAQGVRVLHAAEVNLVKRGMDGHACMTTLVLPKVPVDLVSYSAYDTQQDAATLEKALSFIEQHMAGASTPGKRRVYIGELGFAENMGKPEEARKRMPAAIQAALDWGCPYVVYWQVYCNEPRKPAPETLRDYRGFWILRPDGTQAPSYEVLQQFLKQK